MSEHERQRFLGVSCLSSHCPEGGFLRGVKERRRPGAQVLRCYATAGSCCHHVRCPRRVMWRVTLYTSSRMEVPCPALLSCLLFRYSLQVYLTVSLMHLTTPVTILWCTDAFIHHSRRDFESELEKTLSCCALRHANRSRAHTSRRRSSDILSSGRLVFSGVVFAVFVRKQDKEWERARGQGGLRAVLRIVMNEFVLCVGFFFFCRHKGVETWRTRRTATVISQATQMSSCSASSPTALSYNVPLARFLSSSIQSTR